MPRALVEKYQPSTIDGFIGISHPKRIMAAFGRNPYSSAFLFVGDSGTGKTTLALALAKQIKAEVQHIASRACNLDLVQAVVRRCQYAPMFGEWHMVLCDEADSMSKPAQHAFLSVLDTTGMPKQTVFVFTANSVAALEDRFLSRCRRIDFTTENMEDVLTDHLQRVFRAEVTSAMVEPNYRSIAREAKGNVRAALMLLELEIMCPASTASDAEPDWIISALEISRRVHKDVSTVYDWVLQGKLPKPTHRRPMAWQFSAVQSFIEGVSA